MKKHPDSKEKMMSNTPRVEALIARVMARFPGQTEQSDRRYYPAVHQELGPLARDLERETITMQARVQELETWQRTICELLAPDGDEVLPEDAHDVVSCLRETISTVEQFSNVEVNKDGPTFEQTFLAKRLGRVARLVDVRMPFESDENNAAVAGTILADIAPRIEKKLSATTVTPSKEVLVELICKHLGDAYFCTRVWSAWGVGAMGQDDFSPVADSDMPHDLADEIIAALRTTPDCLTHPTCSVPKVERSEEGTCYYPNNGEPMMEQQIREGKF